MSKKKAPVAGQGVEGQNTIHTTREEMKMSVPTTISQAATVPEGDAVFREFTLSAPLPAGAHYFTVYLKGDEVLTEIDAERPVPHMTDRPWIDRNGDPVHFLGEYAVVPSNISATTAVGVLHSEFACSVYSWCTGHEVDMDGTVLEATRHAGPDRDLLSVDGHPVVWVQDYIADGTRGTNVVFEKGEIAANAHALNVLADQLEALAGTLRAKAIDSPAVNQ